MINYCFLPWEIKVGEHAYRNILKGCCCTWSFRCVRMAWKWTVLMGLAWPNLSKKSDIMLECRRLIRLTQINLLLQIK